MFVICILFFTSSLVQDMISDASVTGKTFSEQGEFNNSKWGMASSCGGYQFQQDRYETTIIPIDGNPIFYSAFDGHVTESVAEIAKQEMGMWITSALSVSDLVPANWAKKCLTSLETKIMKQIIIDAIMLFDEKRIHSHRISGGSTFVGILQTKSHYFIINLGDSQLRIYSSKSNKIIFKTKLHDLSNHEEKMRAIRAGFRIDEKRLINNDGVEIFHRYIRNPITGQMIAMPRCLGDYMFKGIERTSWYKYGRNVSAISAIADVDIIAKDDYPKDVYGDFYAFLFSDGIGDLVEIADKYPNVSKIPSHWRMNFMEQKPGHQDDPQFMQKWAEKIVNLMAVPQYRTKHDNMGILVAKLS